MKRISIAGHITALTVVLIGALIGCGVAPTPAPTPDPEGNGDPILSQMPTAPLLERVTMPFTRTGTRADTPAEIKLSFAKGMNRESVEQAVNLYPAEIKRNDGTPKRLQVKALCDGGWSIRNPNSSAVSFNWSISKSVERGEGMVAANGEQILFTTRGLKQLRLSVNGVLQTRVLSVSSACVKTLEFTWAEDNKSVTVKPLKPMASDAITISLSTAAFSSDGTRMVEPSSETLVPEQIIQANQAIALQFSQAVNKVTLESSLKLFQGKFDSYDTLETTAPRVTNACDGSYTVKNPGTQPLAFTWNIEGSSEKGAGNVAALSETKVTPSSNARAIKVFTDKGINVVRSLEESSACNVSISSVWDASSASVKLNTSSVWKLGSFTVTGSAVNDAGARIARDRLAVVHVVTDDSSVNPNPNPNPNPDPVTPEQPLRAEVDEQSFPVVATAGTPVTLSGFASGRSLDDPTIAEPRVDWTFSDGSSATGAEVDHTFVEPGEYRVVTRVTNSSGISDSLTQTVQVLPSLSKLDAIEPLTDGNDTLTWDFGNPVPGLEYAVNFVGAQGAIIAQSSATRGSQRFEKLGTYTMGLRVLDYREEYRNGTRGKRSSDPEVEYDKTLLEQRASFTRWEKRPIIQLKSYRSDDTAQEDSRALYGDKGMDVTFDASESFGATQLSEMTQTWRICKVNFGRCRPQNLKTLTGGETRNLSFADAGKYTVKLTLKDRYGQFDSRERLVVVTDQSQNFVRGVFDYPIGVRSKEPAFTGNMTVADLPRFGIKPNTLTRSTRDGSEFFEGFFPYVMHESVKFRRMATRWNAWSNGSTFKHQFCESVNGFYNGDPINPPPYIAPFYLDEPPIYNPLSWWQIPAYPDRPPLFCDLIVANQMQPLQPRAIGEVLFTGSSNFQTMQFDIVSGLRVPKISISVVPDELLPGDASIDPTDPGVVAPKVKALELNVGTYNGQQHLVQHIRIRRSEINRGRISFDVPVYAVNAAGQWMRNVTGGFFGNFSSLHPFALQSCGDCVMIEGRAFMRMELDPWMFANSDLQNGGGATQTLDFSKLKLTNDSGSCGEAESPIFKRTFLGLNGCSVVDTSSVMPMGMDEPEPVAYPLLEETFTILGQTFIGSKAERDEITREKINKMGDELKNQLINLLPVIGSVKVFIEGIKGCMDATKEGKQCDAIGLILSGVAVIADAAIIGKLVTFIGKGVIAGITEAFSLSRASAGVGRVGAALSERSGLLADAMNDLTKTALRNGARTLEEVFLALKGADGVMGDVISAASRCKACTSRTETALRGLKKVEGLEGKSGLEWIADKAKKFSNGVATRVDDFMYKFLGYCIGKVPSTKRIEQCERFVNWRALGGAFSGCKILPRDAASVILRLKPRNNTTVGEFSVRGNVPKDCQIFVNQLSEFLQEELATARKFKIKPISIVNTKDFDAIINEGTVKWAITTEGELVFIPKNVGTYELKHSVLTSGKPVVAAGEAEIAGTAGEYYVLEINNQSGHFKSSEESLNYAKKVFDLNGLKYNGK